MNENKFSMDIIFEKINQHLAVKLPFVAYKKPNQSTIFGLFQQNDTLFEVVDFSEKGFVFANFDGDKNFLIPEAESELTQALFEKREIVMEAKASNFQDEISKNSFVNLVFQSVQAIKNEEFKKVVVSRKESLELIDFDVVTSFEKILQQYQNAFSYCFFHPKIGIWMGATPEQLLKSEGLNFKTMALAGTQKDNGFEEVIWHKKEIEEQKIVTDYIVEKISKTTSNLIISKPYSLKAGNVWHIKTDISGTLSSDFSLKKIVQLLHPTPAVCGLPKEASKNFILKNESYKRGFYTGFLGELNRADKTDLFVNLRCMEIENETAHLYMGCGITKESEPEKEWEETINKSMTIKKIINFKS